MVDLVELKKKMRSVGVPAGSSGSSRKPVYEVYCQLCGNAICSDNLSEVEYIQTKRGTELFFSSPVPKEGESRWIKKQKIKNTNY